MNNPRPLISASVTLLLTGCAAIQPVQPEYIPPENEIRSTITPVAFPHERGQQNQPLPPHAKAGECYAKVRVPPKYVSTRERRIKPSTTSYSSDMPQGITTVSEKKLVRPASEVNIPRTARYTYKTEKVLVERPTEHVVTRPAEYKTITRKVLVTPASKVWKKGRGAIEKIDNLTGDVMCLVEIPATYKTVTERVMTQPARTQKIRVPGKYKEVKRPVLVEPARTVKKTIPAQYQLVQTRAQTPSVQQKPAAAPVTYTTIIKRKKIAEERIDWRPVPCETSTTPTLIGNLQQALSEKGYNPGPVDGIIGDKTMNAILAYQRDNELARGQLTIETLYSLGIQL